MEHHPFIAGFSADTQRLNAGVVLVVVAAIAIQFVTKSASARLVHWISRWPAMVHGIAFGIGLVAIDMMGPEGIAPFIYFQF